MRRDSGTVVTIAGVGTVALAVALVQAIQRGSRARRWIQQDAEQAGRAWEGVNPPDDVCASDLDWRYETTYPADRLLGLMPHARREDWSDWLWEENAVRTEELPGGSVEDDLQHQWLGRFKEWWLSTPEEEPIVLVENAAAQPEGIWDGWHRAAVSIVFGGPGATLPAFVGRRRHL